MKKIQRKNNVLSTEERKVAIDKLINFLKKERNETIGIIAAGEILDCIITPIYNRGVHDVAKLLRVRLGDFEVDMDSLKIVE